LVRPDDILRVQDLWQFLGWGSFDQTGRAASAYPSRSASEKECPNTLSHEARLLPNADQR